MFAVKLHRGDLRNSDESLLHSLARAGWTKTDATGRRDKHARRILRSGSWFDAVRNDFLGADFARAEEVLVSEARALARAARQTNQPQMNTDLHR